MKLKKFAFLILVRKIITRETDEVTNSCTVHKVYIPFISFMYRLYTVYIVYILSPVPRVPKLSGEHWYAFPHIRNWNWPRSLPLLIQSLGWAETCCSSSWWSAPPSWSSTNMFQLMFVNSFLCSFLTNQFYSAMGKYFKTFVFLNKC